MWAIGESIEVLAQTIEESGLRLEDHLRASERGIALTCEAVKAIEETGFPKALEFGGNNSLVGVGLSRSPFRHPLTEVSEVDGEPFLNSWGAVSMFISVANGWIDEADEREQCKTILRDCVSRIAPTADLNTMLRRARYDDRVLMQLASYAAQGFDAIARQQAGQ